MEIEQMLSIIRKGEGLNSEFKRAVASIMISMSNLEVLTSPAQKYKLTPMGMFFLGFPKNDDPMATYQKISTNNK
jgi:hypothetical protein